MARQPALVVTAAVVVLLAGGCGQGSPGSAPPTPRPAPSSPGPAGPAPSSPAPSAPGTATAAPVPSAPVARTVLRRGDVGPDVLRWQQRLRAGGYWLGEPDGSFGLLTEQATYAVQKAAGLARDGVAGPRTRAALAAGLRPGASSTTGRVVEVDLARQLLLLVQDGTVRWVLSTSTGSGSRYAYEGRTYLAVTPRGRFHVFAEIDGLRKSHLGLLWRPKYFNGGIALHGAASVPPWPASHGCVRLTDAAIDWVWATGQVPLGTEVRVR